uniref:Uncharacterized protein n=1 Tax=Anguilla anguilla TaxID=7936 RepID=A0A0E9PPS5_ANGAN
MYTVGLCILFFTEFGVIIHLYGKFRNFAFLE